MKALTKAKRENGRRRSMRAELAALVVGVILAGLVLIGLMTRFFLGSFYKLNKISKMRDTYDKVVLMMDDTQNMADEVMEMSVQDNIMVLIANSDLSDSQSTKHDGNRNKTRLFGYISGFYDEKITILKKTDQYVLQETTDTRINTSYLEMWGRLSNGFWFLLQTPLESMQTAVSLTLIFYSLIGSVIVLISLLLVDFLLRRYTRPLVQLTELSKKMASLDFEAKYIGHEKNEIGELGASFNRMSGELERSIEELKSANAALQKDNELKTKIDEQRKEFLANVSHELKTPLALIQGYAEGLKDNVAEDEESRAFYCEVIIDETLKMNKMVRKLLTLNQLEFGNDPVELERFDLIQLIDGVVQGMQLMIADAGAALSINAPESLIVEADEFKIEEVITNYLSNAVHHIGGAKKIEIAVERDGEHLVRVTVTNTGTPIPEEDLPHLFEKFYKVDKARTREYGGSGIGLSIVRAIIEGHHQTFGVKNTGEGVSFWFTLRSI